MTTPTPGQRLHAALLAQDIESDRWDDCHPLYQEAYEAAAREYDSIRTVEDRLDDAPPWKRAAIFSIDKNGEQIDALRDRLDALSAEVAALRRDRDADLAAMGEAGDRIARTETAVAEALANLVKIALRLDDRQAAEARQAAKVLAYEDFMTGTARDLTTAIRETQGRLTALEARARDGGDPLRRADGGTA